MVIHHLDKPDIFFCKAQKALRKGGKLCISDLVLTGLPFHDKPQPDVKHEGFNIDELIKSLEHCGFTNVEVHEATVVEKERDGGKVKFPIFLAIGEK
jgi:hypothetical protein